MADAGVIKEFLVQLGYSVDPKSKKDFLDHIAVATLRVAEFAAAVEAAAVAVVAGVTKMAEGMEELYFASQRTKSSVDSILSLSFAARNLGSSAGGVQNALESIARFMRESPGAVGFIQSLGINANQGAAGVMRDLSARFASMPYYLANAYASRIGIDERTLMAMRSGAMGQFEATYNDMLRRAGVAGQQAAQGAHAFMVQMRTLGAAFDILWIKVQQDLTQRMGEDIKHFRENLVDNFGRISDAIDRVARFLLTAAEVTTRLVIRTGQAFNDLSAWFQGLDQHTRDAIKALALVAVAWKALNAVFAASPIGRIALLITGLILLYDDYKSWKEGSKHVINWETWKPELELATKAINLLLAAIRATYDAYQTLRGITPLNPKDWPTDSPFWRDMPPEEQRKYPNSPINNPGNVRKPFSWWNPGTWFQGSSYPAGTERHNPLNLTYLPGQPGVMGHAGRFGVYADDEHGVAAALNQLELYKQRGITSLRDIVAKWAPPGENDTESYIKQVARRTGWDPNQQINVDDPVQAAKLIQAMSVQEGHPLSMGTVRQGVALEQHTTIIVHGATDPQKTAEKVASAQRDVNADIVRNGVGAVR